MPRSRTPALLLAAAVSLASLSATAVQQAASDRPRGLVAVSNASGSVTVTWRLLASDPDDVAFHVYRRDIYAGGDFTRMTDAPIRSSTSFVDTTARHGSSYRYRVHAEPGGPSRETAYLTAVDWHRPYVSIRSKGTTRRVRSASATSMATACSTT
jgi:hypothetical protein